MEEKECEENIALMKDLGVWDELQEIEEKMRKLTIGSIEYIQHIEKKIELLEYTLKLKKELSRKKGDE